MFTTIMYINVKRKYTNSNPYTFNLIMLHECQANYKKATSKKNSEIYLHRFILREIKMMRQFMLLPICKQTSQLQHSSIDWAKQ